jgi:GT2 family glycosyltransferase
LHRTDYAPIELLIIDNDSREPRTARLLARLTTDPRVRILPFPGSFNWAAMNNAAVRHARGEIIVLLNNDIDVIHPSWLQELVTLAQQPDVGIVGARLLYPDGTLQHAGITIGPGAITGHLYRGAARHDPGHGGMLRHTRSVAAVTGACMAMRRTVFETAGGLETEHLPVTGNDLDLCLRVRAHGWRVVCTPHAELYHAEAASRGPDVRPAQLARARQERAYLVQRWGALAEHDPYLSPNLATVNEQLVLAAPAASPCEVIAGERRSDALDIGQQIGRQSAGRERGAADVQRVR